MELDLYFRYGCGLCDEMLHELQQVKDKYRISWILHDIDRSPELRERYDRQVPVLAKGDEVICRYFLEEEPLKEFLQIHG